MKLSTIIRAIVHPVLNVRSESDRLTIFVMGTGGPGIGAVVNWQSDLSWPARARQIRIGDLTVAWWGRDTLVHPVEAP